MTYVLLYSRTEKKQEKTTNELYTKMFTVMNIELDRQQSNSVF